MLELVIGWGIISVPLFIAYYVDVFSSDGPLNSCVWTQPFAAWWRGSTCPEQSFERGVLLVLFGLIYVPCVPLIYLTKIVRRYLKWRYSQFKPQRENIPPARSL